MDALTRQDDGKDSRDTSRATSLEVPHIKPFQSETFSTLRIMASGSPIEQLAPSQPIQPNCCFEDLEKGTIAPQPTYGANAAVEANALRTQRDHEPGLNNNSSWRTSTLPTQMPTLPPKRNRRLWRRMRHNLYTVYQRLFSIVFLSNMVAFIVLLVRKPNARPVDLSLSSVATATSTNVLGAILIRQENVINILYNICCMTPHWWPLRIRRMIAKLYHFGGVHSGCACSAAAWFILFTALITRNYVLGNFDEPAVIAITYILLTLFVSICVFAIPKFRIFSHNTFEAVHRFAGWAAIGLFWIEILLISHAQTKIAGSGSMSIIVVRSPTFWILLVITFFTVLPWLRLRKVDAFPEVLSNHAVRIRFRYTDIGPVLGLRISHNPLKEWHAFATIPETDGSSFSLIVSNAGDWTKKQIDHPANKYWVRGIPISGVLRMSEVFKSVILVATGSGIGPCLSLLAVQTLNCRILWSTPNPVETYGESIIELVAKADPDAMIINTRTSGRPDMVALTYHLFMKYQAEAVFVISNPSTTRKIVYGMESRGIPAYGPIWDSWGPGNKSVRGMIWVHKAS